DERRSANVASISCGSYGTSGCRSAASSISSLSIPSYVGLTVYFGPPKTLAPVRSARRKANSATAWQVRRSMRSAPTPTSSAPSPPAAPAPAPPWVAGGAPAAHPGARGGGGHAPARRDARAPPAGAADHPAADPLAEDPVRRADVAATLRGDGRRLQPEAMLA